ncbi:transposable element Tc1 transposase [Trichonephila clavipes]|nr:transposable element Tc1 transposase [Trichonephila clavipes]
MERIPCVKRGLTVSGLNSDDDLKDDMKDKSHHDHWKSGNKESIHRFINQNCWEQWTREGTHARKTGSGVTRKTTRREDRRIVRQSLVDPTVTHSMIRADVGVAIVPQTIFRHIAEANLKFKRPFRALPLTPEHRQLRLQWCQARSMGNVTDRQNVVSSDESRFVLGTDDNRVRMRRHPGERYNSPTLFYVTLPAQLV